MVVLALACSPQLPPQNTPTEKAPARNGRGWWCVQRKAPTPSPARKGFPGLSDEAAARADAELAEQDASPYSSGKHMPVPAWALSNRNAEMARLKKRLAQLQTVDKMEHTELDFDGGRIITNEEINRVQILFDEKPDEETRRKLKGYGFRWSPREGAWQAQRTPVYLRRAKTLVGIPDTTPTVQAETPTQTEEPAETTHADVTGQHLFPLG